MKELNKKGNIYLIEHKSGLFCVDRITPSIGETLFASFDLNEAQKFFKEKFVRSKGFKGS